MAALLPMDSPAGTKPRLTGSGSLSRVVELAYSSVTWVGDQRTRDWYKQKPQGASNNKRAVSSSNEGGKHGIGAILSLEIQEVSGTGGSQH